jgi:hypothetical protein
MVMSEDLIKKHSHGVPSRAQPKVCGTGDLGFTVLKRE